MVSKRKLKEMLMIARRMGNTREMRRIEKLSIYASEDCSDDDVFLRQSIMDDSFIHREHIEKKKTKRLRKLNPNISFVTQKTAI
ncbi:hypothetical protein L6303_06045 [archaeon]|nr:hypothetical protein [Nanoarchaeota archaeon]MBU4300357.1 hypothetical protein [Nanoarchaeota archaeon]MBU4452146.1 hypothetical protein [Nanoarchaeota archaeon]MCG2724279.1 hypothetical protein [archaeon]